MFYDVIVWLETILLQRESSCKASGSRVLSMDTFSCYSDWGGDCDLLRGEIPKLSCACPISGKQLAVGLLSMYGLFYGYKVHNR